MISAWGLPLLRIDESGSLGAYLGKIYKVEIITIVI